MEYMDDRDYRQGAIRGGILWFVKLFKKYFGEIH